MPKNVTVSVPDDLANEMEQLPEVNWSQVARTAIKQYIALRKHPDISDLLEDLEKQKGEEYLQGRLYAKELVKKIGYKEFSILLNEYADRVEDERQLFNVNRMFSGFRSRSNEEVMIKLLKEKGHITEASESFSSGLTSRLFEIQKTMRG